MYHTYITIMATANTPAIHVAEQKVPDITSSSKSNSLRQPSPVPSKYNMPPVPKRQDTHTSASIEDYFARPRDTEKHSKLPYFIRMHGSITPRMIVPLVFVGFWATLITCISEYVYPLVVNSLLLTVLGFVVGLGISFRTSSAYERYVDGRKYWAQLIQASRLMAHLIWVHAEERHGQDADQGKADLLAKLTGLNLIVAFAVSLKHRLRFEPYANYEDLEPLVSHLSTFAADAYDPDSLFTDSRKSSWKVAGEFLGLTFAESNPRKLIKRSKKPLGNLPLEIFTYLSAYFQSIISNGTLPISAHQSMAMASLSSLNEVLAGTERVLNTPLPIAYSIAISQITWVYVIALPFQLWKALGWITIPGTLVGAYIILGIAAIGHEIENPFGLDVNDLPLDKFCQQLRDEMAVIASKPRPKAEDFMITEGNKVIHDLSYNAWQARSIDEIRATLKARGQRTAKESVQEQEVLVSRGDV